MRQHVSNGISTDRDVEMGLTETETDLDLRVKRGMVAVVVGRLVGQRQNATAMSSWDVCAWAEVDLDPR